MIKDFKETTYTHLEGDDYVTYSSSERKWVNKFRRDIEKYPDDVEIVYVNDDGSMVVRYPCNWVPMPRPKRKRSPMTEEQRAAAAERLAKGREAKIHS